MEVVFEKKFKRKKETDKDKDSNLSYFKISNKIFIS